MNIYIWCHWNGFRSYSINSFYQNIFHNFNYFSILFVNKYNNEVAFARGILMYIVMLKRSFYHVMQFESAYFREQKNFTCMLVSFQ